MAKNKEEIVDFQKGDGGHTYFNGHRVPYTVVKRTGKSIWCSKDRYKVLKEYNNEEGPLECTFETVEVSENDLVKFMLKPDGTWRERGKHGWQLHPGREFSCNPSD